MESENRSYRIRTSVGSDAPNVINVKLEQTYDMFEILSLKLTQENAYKLYESDYGIIVGRVNAEGNFGVPNAKVSVFIQVDDSESIERKILYPYTSVRSANNDGVRYNLLPEFVDNACHQNVGTFPTKRYVLDNDDVIEIFDKYWKYTTTTNQAGDYMLFGIPKGGQQIHVDVDLSDIGMLSIRPRDMVYKGYNINQFESPNKFKSSTNLNSLSQIFTQDIGVYVYPFWGDTTNTEDTIAITRCDIQLDYKFEPTCVFMGSIITDTGSNAIGKNCAGNENVGKMSDLVTGEGSIEMIRKTIDNKVEEFQIKGNRVIDGDGVWCYQIPMNLDYIMTDEFGNIVPTDDPDKGIPTRARVRFRITLDDPPSDNAARKRCRYLVPNNPRMDERYPKFLADEEHMPDYEFGTSTLDESYCDLFWNKVYTVKNYIPRLQKNSKITNRKHTGIKLINHYGDNNPMPYNNLSIKLSFTYRLICVLTKIFIKLVGFLNNIITLLGMIPCQLANFFKSIASFFNFKILGWRPLRPVAKLFEGIAAIFDLMTPTCIAISSEFCGSEVTHAYTFYPGCGMFLGLTFGLLKCVWNKTKENHNKHMINGEVDEEDRTTAVNKSAELYNCVEASLAEENDAASFNFQNDWVNGILYAPMWFRKITPKKKFLFGLFRRRAKDEWCSANHVYTGSLRIFQPCAVKREDGDTDTKYPDISNASPTRTPKYMKGGDCGDNCHEVKTTVGIDMGLIVSKETMLGQTVYYYKPVEYDAKLNNVKILFASDIVLLGSLNDCDINGIPQFFKSLESTTYKLPPNLLFTDNVVVQKFDEQGNLITDFDQISNTEMTGNDWGNTNDDICGEPDGGLFYSIGCSTIEMQPKSCINLSRICEFGVSLDETKWIPNSGFEGTDADSSFDVLIPDGYVSKDELYNDNERSMFATLNGNFLQTKLNTENGLKEYDFRHLYVSNFDKSLYEIMKARQNRCGSDITYRGNYNLEDFSRGYYMFRMGGINAPFFYDSDGRLPRYENSFYFYFGLKSGKTAIDKFNSQFFANCENPEDAGNQVGMEIKANTWCAEKTGDNDGYVKLSFKDISTPYSIIINGVTDSSFGIELTNITSENISFSKQTFEGYEQMKDSSGKVILLNNGTYDITITDADGTISSAVIEMTPKYLRFTTDSDNFKEPFNVRQQKWGTSVYNKSANDKTGYSNTELTREIGGTIVISDIIDGYTNQEMTDYQIEVSPVNSKTFDGYTSYKAKVIGGGTPTITGDGNVAVETVGGYRTFVVGVPMGDVIYEVKVSQLCGDEVYRNILTKKIKIKEPTPYKLYINDTIDYDVISDWTTGYELNGNGFPSKSGTLSAKWLQMSNPDNYKWDEYNTIKEVKTKSNELIKIFENITSSGGSLDSGISNYVTQIRTILNKSSWSYGTDYANFIKLLSDLAAYIDGNETLKNEYGDIGEQLGELGNELAQTISDFIDDMKSAFWINCKNEDKTVTFKAVTDDTPVHYYVSYREEEVAEDEDDDYNILAANKMETPEESTAQISGIRIPTITTKDNENYYNASNSLGNNVYLAYDKRTGVTDKNKYPYFVAVKNSKDKTIPSNADVASYKNFFSFHMIDKVFDINQLAWACVQRIPFYGLPDTDSRKGTYVNMLGLYAAKVLNGIVDSTTKEFEEATLSPFTMKIYTKSSDEDAIPVERYVVSDNVSEIAEQYKNIKTYRKFFYEELGDSTPQTPQYCNVLPFEMDMNITDKNYCQLNDTVYGGMKIALNEEAVDDRLNLSQLLNVHIDEGEDENIVYCAYIVSGSNYVLNEATPITAIVINNNTYCYINDTISGAWSGNTNDVKLFSFETGLELLQKKAELSGLPTKRLKDGTVDEYEYWEGWGNNGEFTIHRSGFGRNLMQNTTCFIVAIDTHNCRTISPVYDFTEIPTEVVYGEVQMAIEKETNGGDDEGDDEPVEETMRVRWMDTLAVGEETTNDESEDGGDNDEGGDDDKPVEPEYEIIKQFKVGCSVKETLPYYIRNYQYDMKVEIKIDEMNVLEKENDGISGISPVYVDTNDAQYKMLTGLGVLSIKNKATVEIRDCTGLLHRLRPSNVRQTTWYVVTFDSNGGQWSDGTEGQRFAYPEQADINPYSYYNSDDMAIGSKTFVGWSTKKYDKEDIIGTSDTVTAPVILYAVWLEDISVTFDPDSSNGGQWSDGTSNNVVESVDVTNKATCGKGIPVNSDSTKVFDKWVVSEGDSTGVTINSDGSVVTDHNVTVKATYKTSTGDKVKVKFVVSTNNGKWYDDNSTTDYEMEVEANSTVSCDRIAISTSPLLYGFNGWNESSSATSGSNTVTVGITDKTVYAIFKEKDCQISINDVSTGSDNISLEIETQSSAGGTHWEYTGFTGECHQNMIGGNGTLECNGITSNSIIRLYVADEIFYVLNGNDYFADVYKNNAWHFDEINAKLQDYNICYTNDGGGDDEYVLECQNSGNNFSAPIDAGEYNLPAYLSTKNGEYFDDVTFESDVDWIQPSGTITRPNPSGNLLLIGANITAIPNDSKETGKTTTIHVKQNGGKTVDLFVEQRISSSTITINIKLKNEGNGTANFSTLGVYVANGRSFTFPASYSVAQGGKAELTATISDYFNGMPIRDNIPVFGEINSGTANPYYLSMTENTITSGGSYTITYNNTISTVSSLDSIDMMSDELQEDGVNEIEDIKPENELTLEKSIEDEQL